MKAKEFHQNENVDEMEHPDGRMAIKAQATIIPVTIAGSAAIQPPGRYTICPGRIRVVFHDPIDTKGMKLEDRDRLVELTREAIASELTTV